MEKSDSSGNSDDTRYADNSKAIPLAEEDEPHRYPLQLYNCVARQADWAGCDALEVGCGRG